MSIKLERDKLRFLSKVEKLETGCWKWLGSHFQSGYAMFFQMVNGKEVTRKASRAAYEFFNGELQEGLHVLHRCNERWCVNPEHLYLGTHERNMKDRDEAGRTSKWSHRYNFVQTPELEQKVKELRDQKLRVEDICKQLDIGKTTYYRMARRGIVKVRKHGR